MSTSEKIPFRVEINRIVELLAKQIYQSPLALLRENCQNAYDAILQRQYLGQAFEPLITVAVTSNEIVVRDNGIGMTKTELIENYWRAGSSGKNTQEARAAGVIGTFGIGAMANFGIASELWVESESARTGEHTATFAARDSLSATDECIQLDSKTPTGRPGTLVRAVIPPSNAVNLGSASAYLSECVRYLPIPVMLNGTLISKQDLTTDVARPSGDLVNKQLIGVTVGSHLTADIEILAGRAAEVWICVKNFIDAGTPISGLVLLRQNAHQIKTLRSKFALANAAVSSFYGLGGVGNLPLFQPTAGREALTTQSLQVLQTMVTECEKYASYAIAETEAANQNTGFMDWVYNNNRLELLSNLTIRLEPENRSVSLRELAHMSKSKRLNYYEGSDQSLINQFASEDQPLIVISTRQPRRKCELAYLQKYCRVVAVEDKPTVLALKKDRDLNLGESTLALRIVSILESDYFVRAEVQFGKMSHGVTIYIEATKVPVQIVLDPDSSTIATILKVYDADFLSMTGLIKDFVRTAIFPKITHLVPSSTRQGAEAFLRAIRKPRDVFEYEKADLGSLSDIWQEYVAGKISLAEAARQSSVFVRTSVQVVDRTATRTVESVLPDVLENEQILAGEKVGEEATEEFQALPAITRFEKESSAKLLIIDDNQPALKGYRCFLAITERVRSDRGEFFLQPHRTEIVWGGQKALYIFQHHSGEFGLYYELQSKDILSDAPGGRAFPTCTIVIKNQVYIPVPDEIRASFIPSESDRKSFEIRCELLYPETGTMPEEDKGQPTTVSPR